MSNAASEQISAIDEYGELQRFLAPIRPKLRRESELRKIIESFCADVPADESRNLQGDVYQVVVGPRKLVRTIVGMQKLFDKLGDSQFLKFCTFPLTIVDDLGVDTDGILSEDRSGPRTVNQPVLRDQARARRSSVAGRKPRSTRGEARV